MVSAGGRAAQVLHGPSLLGIFLNVGLYGVMLSQTHTYYQTFTRDPLWIKVYVGILLFADTLNTAFNVAWIYNVLINEFGNLDALMRADWLFESEAAMAGLIAMMAQLFYARRILVLTKKRWLFMIVVLTSIVAGLAAIGAAIGAGIRPEFSGLQSLYIVGLTWLVASAACDIIIVVSLSVYLNRHKTGLKKTDSVLNKKIMSIVQSGLLTASFNIAHMVAYLASPSGIYMIFTYGVVKLYTNSVMSSLNMRREWTDSLAGGMSFVEFKASSRSDPALWNRPQVAISVETYEMVEIAPLPRAKREKGSPRSRSSQLDTSYDP